MKPPKNEDSGRQRRKGNPRVNDPGTQSLVERGKAREPENRRKRTQRSMTQIATASGKRWKQKRKADGRKMRVAKSNIYTEVKV